MTEYVWVKDIQEAKYKIIEFRKTPGWSFVVQLFELKSHVALN